MNVSKANCKFIIKVFRAACYVLSTPFQYLADAAECFVNHVAFYKGNIEMLIVPLHFYEGCYLKIVRGHS